MHYNNTWTITNISSVVLLSVLPYRKSKYYPRDTLQPGVVKRTSSSGNPVDRANINPPRICVIKIYPGNKVTDLSPNLKERIRELCVKRDFKSSS